jgi:DNA-binding NtrC family response regulator
MADRIFSGENYEIEMALGGLEGIRRAKGESFDLILVDMKMPDISGLDVIRMIRDEQPDAMMIMITGHSSADSAVEASKVGAFDCISKPFTPDEISMAVKRALQHKEHR